MLLHAGQPIAPDKAIANPSPLLLQRVDSTLNISIEDKELLEVEYFFASDASAVIEHTKRVIFLEDNDVAAVSGGSLHSQNIMWRKLLILIYFRFNSSSGSTRYCQRIS
jgi:hypothetical protein